MPFNFVNKGKNNNEMFKFIVCLTSFIIYLFQATTMPGIDGSLKSNIHRN